MNHFSNLLLIGGTGRNVGKTTLAEMIIKKFSLSFSLIALKTSLLLPGEEYLHGNHKLIKPNEFLLEEESIIGTKDSQRYLKAGAKKSFFLSMGEKVLENAMGQFWGIAGNHSLVVAESNVLSEILFPGVFVMIKGGELKPQAEKMLLLADEIVPAMDFSLFEEFVNRLEVVDGKWIINSKS